MAFLNGTVSFSRLRVVGGGPKRLDDNLLDKLRTHRIGQNRTVGRNFDDVGWHGGRHLLDGAFDIEKNVILDCLHFGLRVDAARIPPDLLRAYIEMEFESLTQDGGNRRARRTGSLRQEARDAALRRADKELRDGRYRSMRQFPMMLDTREDVLYSGATQPAVLEKLHPLFKDTLGKRLEPLSAGALAAEWAERAGVSRRIDGIRPARIVPHSSGNGHIDVYWTAHDAASCDYLGNEFLLWLWYALSEQGDTLRLSDDSNAAIVIVKHLTLECPWAESGKVDITCEGPTQLKEARKAVQAGKLPRKAGLLVNRQGEQYAFTLQAETFNVSGAALPKHESIAPDSHGGANGNGSSRRSVGQHASAAVQTAEAQAGTAVLDHDEGGGMGVTAGQRRQANAEERVEQIRHMAETIDLIYGVFLEKRLRDGWNAEAERIRAWLRSR